MITKALRVTTPTDKEIVMERTFNAPSRMVFDAFTRPELLKRWFGARGWNLVDCEVDLRVGGAWRFVSRGPDGSDLGHGGVYREIVPGRRLVYTEAYDQWFHSESLVTTVFSEHSGKTMVITTLLYESQEIRDSVIKTPMERGVGESYARLDDVLASTDWRGEAS